MDPEQKIRILIAKPGLDGHERGARVVAYGLRDAGFEVIYTGLRQTPGQIAKTAVDEDVDVIGLSILSGAHLTLTREVRQTLEELSADDIILLVGGIIPESDVAELKEMGVTEVFTSGTPIADITETVKKAVADSRVRS
ncbi:MAG: cobalamin B12-binding domain-containing protein [Desulfosudaceae bacterium]